MSKFQEGWCRTAHEAMLLKTPVVGSGFGGMSELLEGGGQIICDNFNDLKEKIEYLLGNHEARKIPDMETQINFAFPSRSFRLAASISWFPGFIISLCRAFSPDDHSFNFKRYFGKIQKQTVLSFHRAQL